MVCPKCGHILQRRWMDQLPKIAGLGFSLCTAIIGQAELIGEPYRHYVTVAGIIGVGIFGTVIQLYKRQPAPAVSDGVAIRETDK